MVTHPQSKTWLHQRALACVTVQHLLHAQDGPTLAALKLNEEGRLHTKTRSVNCDKMPTVQRGQWSYFRAEIPSELRSSRNAASLGMRTCVI